MNGLLEGLRVIEVSAYVAAPFAGASLARLGAEVIRIEQLGGGIDIGRWPVLDGRSLYRQGLDQGKRSVALDLRSEPGRELVAQLICSGGERGGIVASNLGGRGCLTYENLRARRPDLVMVLLHGTPEGGSAVDYTVNAGLGFPYLTGPADGERPVNHVLPAWDLLAGALAATSILAAERKRRLTGEGALVELALSEVALGAVRSLGLLAEAALIEEPRGRHHNDLYGTYGRDFRTADGRDVMLCALTNRQWQCLTEVTGIVEEVARIEREHGVDLRDEGARFECRDQINALVEPWVAARTVAEVGAAFDAAGVLWGPYRTLKELVAERPEVVELELPAPELGADTEQVLRDELGLSRSAIAELRSQKVIG
jgi:2-methylfumaryl-CoA isomerase